MSRKTMVAAASLAAVGAAAFHFYLRRFEAEMAGGAPQAILVATQDLALGEVITRAALDVKEVPESYVEDRHIAGDDLERVLGARVTSSVHSGGALFWTDLDTMQDGRTLSGLVRVGMRAYALHERDASFNGLLRPGDRVDVVFTPAENRSDATTLLTNVLVLTVGADLGQEGVELAREAGGRVTLSITPEQATVLAQREGTGKIRLTLRNPHDAVVPKPAALPAVADAARAGASAHAK